MKKICKILSISLCLAMLLSVNAFAAAPDEAGSGDWPETIATTSETTDIEPEAPVGIPPRVISNWLSEQIRLEVDYCEIYGTKDVTVVHLKLSDATKIIFIADQLCPTGYTDDGGYFASGVNVPCGIGPRLYRYLSTTSRAAAMYDFGGATTLMAKYSPEELAAIYEDLREAAMPYHAELIEWLDSFSVTIRVPNYGTLWNGIIVPQPEPVEDVFPVTEPVEDVLPVTEPLKHVPTTVEADRDCIPEIEPVEEIYQTDEVIIPVIEPIEELTPIVIAIS